MRVYVQCVPGGPFCANFGASVVCFGAADDASNRSRARVALCAVASSGLRPSRAFSKSAATLSNRSGKGLVAVPDGRRARSMLHVIWTDVEEWRLIATAE